MERPRFITQEDEADAPARNTRAQRRTLTQEVMYFGMNIMSTPATPKHLASRKFPMKLLEYRYLRINPQYRQVWGKLFGDEIGRLAQGMPNRVDGTDTMFLLTKTRYQKNAKGT